MFMAILYSWYYWYFFLNIGIHFFPQYRNSPLHDSTSVCISLRSFRLTHAIACAHVSTHTNLSARAISRTHEKSYSAEKVLSHRIFFFQSFVFVYERHL